MVTMEHNPNLQFTKAHLTTLNLNNYKTIEAIGLKLMHRCPLEWLYLRTKFNEILPSSSKIISGGYSDRQTGDLISLL
jgi:hypothetical protein